MLCHTIHRAAFQQTLYGRDVDNMTPALPDVRGQKRNGPRARCAQGGEGTREDNVSRAGGGCQQVGLFTLCSARPCEARSGGSC